MWGGSRASSRPPRTWRWRSGKGSARSCRRDRCGRSSCGRRTRTGRRSVIKPDTAAPTRSVHVTHGFFDDLPVADACADVVVACSALTPAPGHGGGVGLAEMERVCAPGGCVVIVWPNEVDWLAACGYEYVRFDGAMSVEFASPEEAAELIEVFYPRAVGKVPRGAWRQVPYEVLGNNPPRDLAFKLIAR